MTEIIELLEHPSKQNIYIRKSEISYIKPGLYTTIILHCGKEIKIADSINKVLNLLGYEKIEK